MYNCTTKNDFVITCLQILRKTAKIDQRVTTTGRSFRNDTMDRRLDRRRRNEKYEFYQPAAGHFVYPDVYTNATNNKTTRLTVQGGGNPTPFAIYHPPGGQYAGPTHRYCIDTFAELRETVQQQNDPQKRRRRAQPQYIAPLNFNSGMQDSEVFGDAALAFTGVDKNQYTTIEEARREANTRAIRHCIRMKEYYDRQNK